MSAYVHSHTDQVLAKLKRTRPCISHQNAGTSHLTQVTYSLTKVTYSLTKVTYSLTKVPYSLTKVPYSLNKVTYSLTKVPYSLNKVPYSLIKVPYSLIKDTSNAPNGQTPHAIDYAGSDSVYSATEAAVLGGSPYSKTRIVPILAGCIVIPYNIPNTPTGFQLNISRENIVGIFNGTILTWRDALFIPLNPYLQAVLDLAPLNAASISITKRNESSGSTNILTSGLNAMSSVYKAAYPASSSMVTAFPFLANDLPIVGANNVAIAILRKDYAMGYLERSTAELYGLKVAAIVNRAGSYVTANTVSLQSAVDDFIALYPTVAHNNFKAAIVDGPGTASYPFSSFTNVALRLDYPSTTSVIRQYELMRFIDWCTTDSQAASAATTNGFVAIPASVFAVAQSILADYIFLGTTNTSAYTTVVADKAEELRISL